MKNRILMTVFYVLSWGLNLGVLAFQTYVKFFNR